MSSAQAEQSLSGSIVVDGLSMKYGALKALENVSLKIDKGELFGLLGPNGAGKTTLISILSTMLPASSGQAFVCGYDVRKEEAKVRQSIGIVFQDPSLDEELTAQENLDFHARLYGLDSRTRRVRAREVLRLVGLEDRRKDLVKTYSGGMRRRLEIARGLMHTPAVLFLDEPTLGLDPQTRRNIWDHIRALKKSVGTTIILTTHYMDEADHLCSRIAIMDRGKIVALGSPQELKGSLGGDVLEIEVVNAHEEFTKSLNQRQEVRDVVAQDGRLILTVERGESFIPVVFETAAAQGVGISSVSMRTPKLEDVFLKLTGREIRDDTHTEAKDRMRLFMTRKRR